MGGQLTQLLNSEKITPIEGVEEEFLQIIDNILSDIIHKINLLALKDELRTKVYSNKNEIS